MKSPVRALLVGILCALSAPAQQRSTARVFGMLRTEDGAPWIGATVEVLARPVPDDENLGVAEHLVVISDAAGRFRAPTDSRLAFTVFAWSDAGGGSYRVSQVAEDVVAGDAVLLSRTPAMLHRRVVEFEPAPDLGPFRVEVRANTANVFVVPLPLSQAPGENPRATLPPLPLVDTDVEVFRADGLPLIRSVVSPGVDDPESIVIPKPPRTRALVRDVATAGPAPAAVVFVQVHEQLVPIGTLDADGCGEFDRPAFGSVFVRCPGCGLAPMVDGPELARRDGMVAPALRADFAEDMHSRVAAAPSVRGRMLVGAERSAAGATLVVRDRALYFRDTKSRTLQSARRSMAVGADGRFELGPVFDSDPSTVHLVLPPELRRALPEAWRDDVLPVVPFAIDPTGGVVQPDGSRDLGDLDLLDMVPIRLVVNQVDGSPALGARLRLAEVSAARFDPRALGPDVSLDRRGTVVLLLPQGRSFVGLVTARSGDADWISIHSGERKREHATARIDLREPVRLRARIVDRAGEPVRGRVLRLAPERSRPIQRRPAAPAMGSFSAQVVDFQIDKPFLTSWIDVELQGRTARTDEKGEFTMPVPPCAARYHVVAPGVVAGIDFDPTAAEQLHRIEIDR